MPSEKPSYLYKILFTVELTHTYFSQGYPPGLLIRPTIHTQEMMKGLLLQLRRTARGFMIIYDELRLPALLHYLEVNGSWTNLSFTLETTDPGLGNVTDLPLNMLTKTLFLSNLYAHPESPGSDRLLLHPGAFEKGAQSTVISSSELKVTLPEKNQRYLVEIVAISGVVVLSRIIKPSPDMPAVYLDLSPLPEGRYTLRVTQAEQLIRQEQFIYVTSSSPVLGFLDLFLQAPSNEDPAFFPVQNGAIVPQDYGINLKTRSTRWKYFLVFPGERQLSGLLIKSIDNEFSFDGPEKVPIGNGVMAWRFISREPIPLKQFSPYKFKLYKNEDELVSRLAVAGPTPILPEEKEVFSPIYIII